MRIGYGRKLTSSESSGKQRQELREWHVDTIFIDNYQTKEVWQTHSQFRKMLNGSRSGDILVISSLEKVSRSYTIWLAILEELSDRQVELEVQLSPDLKVREWHNLLAWYRSNEQELSRRLKVVSVRKEPVEEAYRYQAFSKDREGRKVYWQIFYELFSGVSLRKISRNRQVSQGTVYRIKNEMARIKHLIWLIGTFVVTLLSFQVASLYSDNGWLRLLIGTVATGSIIYFTYSDMKEE